MRERLLRRLHRERAVSLSLGRVAQTPVSSGLAVVGDALDSSGSLPALVQSTFLCIWKDTRAIWEVWFIRYNYTGSVSGVIFFCFIFVVVGRAE